MIIDTYMPDGRLRESFWRRAGRGTRKMVLYGLGATMAYQAILNYSAGNPYASAGVYAPACVAGMKPSGAPVGALGRVLGCYNFGLALGIGRATARWFDPPVQLVPHPRPQEGHPGIRNGQGYYQVSNS